MSATVGGRPRVIAGLRRLGPAGVTGVVGLVVIIIACAVGRFLLPVPRIDLEAIITGPSWVHPLGTDYTGRDNLHLLLRGGWDMLQLAAVAGLVTAGIAVTLGMLGAFLGGTVDKVIVLAIDAWLTAPRFVLLLVIASLVRVQNMLALAVLIAVFAWPYLARQIRAQALSLRRREYVEAARLLQLRTPHIIVRYLVPAIAPFVVISTIQAMTSAIYQQVGLAFFGLVPLDDNWGSLFSVAYQQNALYYADAAWSLLMPVAAICLLQFCLVLTSQALESRFDPRLRGDA